MQQVSLVINYDLPTNRENYIHRCVGALLSVVCATLPEFPLQKPSAEPHSDNKTKQWENLEGGKFSDGCSLFAEM